MTGGRSPKRVGSQWERDVRDYLNAHEVPTARAYGAGRRDDQGDLLLGTPLGFLLECKAHRELRLAEWLNEARAKCHPGDVPWIIARRRNAGAGRAYAVTDLEGLALVTRQLTRPGDFGPVEDLGTT